MFKKEPECSVRVGQLKIALKFLCIFSISWLKYSPTHSSDSTLKVREIRSHIAAIQYPLTPKITKTHFTTRFLS